LTAYFCAPLLEEVQLGAENVQVQAALDQLLDALGGDFGGLPHAVGHPGPVTFALAVQVG